MSIEQHAEAAAEDLQKRYSGEGPDSRDIIETHMQSAIDEATAPLRARISELERSLRQQNYEVCQTLGKALRYPWFKDDQVNFPGASRLDGVCTADHTPETLAAEAAKRIEKLEGLGPLIEEYGDRCKSYGQSIQSCGSVEQKEWRAMRDASFSEIDAILKGGSS